MRGLFKNAMIYQITQPAKDYIDALTLKVGDSPYKPCGPSQASSVGFVPVFKGGPLVYEQQNFVVVRVKKQSKSLPASGINELVDEKIEEIEEAQARKVYRKEKLTIKDEIIAEKLPSVLPTSETIFAYIDLRLNMIIVDAGSEAKADIVLHLIREALGSFPVMIPEVQNSPKMAMTRWLQQRDAAHFKFGRDCVLQEAIEGGASLRVKDDDLFSDCIEAAINEGKQVENVAMSYDDSIRFDLHSQNKLKRISLYDDIEPPEEETPGSVFDTEIFIMVEQLHELIPKVGAAFGGYLEQGHMQL
jgi:recombination associated protein RdgC